MNIYFEAIFEIIRTGHWITDSITRELKEFDIYEPQFNVLRILRGAKGKPISVNTILENMVQRSSNVSRIVDKLEIKGLVERTLCTEDRRKMDIIITNKGLELLKKLDKKVHDFHKPMMNNLNAEEADTLKQLIKKLKGQLQ
ncbi:DNA-binding MarR family transcriptional regulator [Aquimarina sp. EL_43]|uniref:MarR family winged helix-turn-helix transcriptional regulator n=1 Tax=unclassified Aquimarina TaxID=2627091 RepID=UPI0018C9D9CB|nr:MULTISPECIES: MarR family transcriptional regulator [unclassified Aquimarina]MBG6129447.1 DNA-binding MarR family transcriptional regulator [Aquimarina sp. EL_35]MBG6150512.1 DNA-binding MarR family transcriptional regulator [Aquimarina sp. EL_32]MBG6168180.1 DNA-binding MarR family transcriptional regulator [Aquimarina sp. EL_43]